MENIIVIVAGIGYIIGLITGVIVARIHYKKLMDDKTELLDNLLDFVNGEIDAVSLRSK